MDRLDAIIEQRPSWPATTVLRGTAAERLGEAIALGDPLSLTVVVNSYVVAYFTEADQASFFEDMAERCAGATWRGSHWSHRSWSIGPRHRGRVRAPKRARRK